MQPEAALGHQRREAGIVTCVGAGYSAVDDVCGGSLRVGDLCPRLLSDGTDPGSARRVASGAEVQHLMPPYERILGLCPGWMVSVSGMLRDATDGVRLRG